jgi:hypothetical protein
MLEYLVFTSAGFVVAELLSRIKLKTLIVFQRSEKVKEINSILAKISTRGVTISFGKKKVDLHHCRLGWGLVGLSILITNLTLLATSLGIILHHLVRERKLF